MKIALPTATQPHVFTRHKRSIVHTSLASLVFGSVFLVAQAASSTGANTPSYTIKIVSTPIAEVAADSMNKPAPAVTGQLVSSTQRTMRLDDGGLVWVSSDPLALTPSLGISTSQTVEINDGQFESPLSFTLSTKQFRLFRLSIEFSVLQDHHEFYRRFPNLWLL